MPRELFVTKNKNPKVSFDEYALNPSEPPDYLSHDLVHELELKLMENSAPLRRRFRRLAKYLRSQRATKMNFSESMSNDGYLCKFNKNERRRIISQLAEMKKAEKWELSDQDAYIILRKQKINMNRQKQGLMPIL